jgi:acyl-CoA synthetase (AMP-forming)/AMP-acid ligase II
MGAESGQHELLSSGLFSSLVDLLRYRAASQPHDRAYVFLSNLGHEEAAMTFGDLHHRALAVAQRLSHRTQSRDRALLLFPPGLDFIIAFFGCVVAGLIPVPMMIPRRASSRDASAAILADCSPRLAMTNRSLAAARPDVIEHFRTAALEWIILDQSELASDVAVAAPGPDDIAFLQYTSGSTSAPKGVVVSHRNLLDNSEMIRLALGDIRDSTFVSWVPLYHDMGLILNVLQTLYVGTLCVLMAPVNFMQRPLAWLRAIHAYRAEVATAPNFAFDLCVLRFRAEQMEGIDLSSWKIALNGAEPVRADTIDRFTATFAPYGFKPNSMYPAYGLAEATLLAAAGRRGRAAPTRNVSRAELQHGRVAGAAKPQDRQILVGCGQSLVGERLAIVEPQSRRRLGADLIGEVWVNGPNVTQGYWQNPDATMSTFQARIAGEGNAPWLRTGDLGFLDSTGELFITGRLKDVIIIRGMNHYPQDIESTVQNAHPALRLNGGAAFAALDENGLEKLIVIQEVDRTYRRQVAAEELVASIREAVINEHEVNPDEILLLRPGGLPVTTSGKVQRSQARMLWQNGSLELLD